MTREELCVTLLKLVPNEVLQDIVEHDRLRAVQIGHESEMMTSAVADYILRWHSNNPHLWRKEDVSA